MKRILGTIAAAGLLAAAPAAFAEVDVFFNFGTPAPTYSAPAPVYITPAPVAYRHWEPRWHERRYYDHRRHHGHEFRGHDRDFRHDHRY